MALKMKKLTITSLHRRALALSLLVIALDQLCKWIMLYEVGIANRPPIEVLPFFNLVMVWNYGISFGMLAEPGTNIPIFLIVTALVIVGVLLYWLYHLKDRFLAFSVALVIGGALGNVIDRILYGAVADFFDVHVAGYHWPAFNIADSAVFIGVMLLLYDSFFRRREGG